MLVAASLPRWLPAAVIRLRMWIFARINGEETIELPGASADAARFKRLYSHPAANGRSRGAALSDVFWYWLSPGPEIHQEHLEPGERYDKVAATTRRILALPRRAAEELARRCVARAFGRAPVERAKLVRLRDWAMPIWADFYYKLVFGEACPVAARRLIVDNANDVVTALKCCGLRHMRKRDRLTRFLTARIEAGGVPHDLPPGLDLREQALYLQGVFFNTAIVQMSEATAHLLFVLAQHAEVQDAVLAGSEDDALSRPRDGGDDASLSAVRNRAPDHLGRHRGRRGHDDSQGFRPLLQLPRVPPRRLAGAGALRPRPLERVAPRAMPITSRSASRATAPAPRRGSRWSRCGLWRARYCSGLRCIRRHRTRARCRTADPAWSSRAIARSAGGCAVRRLHSSACATAGKTCTEASPNSFLAPG